MKIGKSLEVSLKPSKSFFTIVVIAFGVVMFWRGVWNLLDLYLFPGSPILSDIASIALGLFVIYLPDKSFKDLI
ncbi:hypothetical protein KJ632_03440 [Patescibacteria group bacterium]|nr:hypothetical protein [Patescibacteria group bacterium]